MMENKLQLIGLISIIGFFIFSSFLYLVRILIKGNKHLKKIHRPLFVEEKFMNSIGYKLISDNCGYLKYESEWKLNPICNRGTKYESKIGNGKRIIYFNTTYQPCDDCVFVGIREDADTRNVFSGVVFNENQLLMLLDLVR